MAPVTLPPSFYNSFWSPDYRTGLEVLFKQLHQGVLEDEDVAEFIESQVKAHQALAATLLSPPIPSSSSSSQTSSSLQHTLLSLRGASSARGEAHNALAAELEQKVLAGFNQWKVRHEDRIRAAKDEYLTTKTGVVGVWEKDVQKLSGLRQTYLNKSRAADDSEDDAKFAPATASPVATVQSPPMDNYTSSPKPQSAALALKRSGTVADRINEKLRAASVSNSPTPQPYKPLMVDGKTLPAPPSPLRPHAILEDNGNGGIVQSPNSPKEDAFIPPSDPHGRPTFREVQEEGGGPAVPPKSHNKTSSISSANGDSYVSPILLSGLSLTSQALKELLRKLDTYLLTHPAPYSDASFASNSSSRSNAALASRQRGSIIGTYEKTFSGEEVVQWLKENVEGFGGDWDRCVEAATELYQMGHLSRIGVGRGFDPNYDTYFILKMVPSQSTNPLSAVGSPLSPATSTNIQTMLKNYIPSGLGGGNDEPPHIRLRREATKADEAYREAVRSVEEKRLEMEQRIERGLRVWERWERERLSVVKSVLKQYDEAIAKLPSRLSSLHDSTSLSVEAFNPEADLKALIEGNRTGPFRPQPHIYDSIETDVPDVNFGVDLRKWSGELGWKGMLKSPTRPKGAIPEVLQALLSTLHEVYTGLPEEERRRSWIYEVPLVETHTLRSAINSSRSGVEELSATIKRFNAPVIAGVIKLYLLELNPPVMGWEGWEDAKAVYPSVGADLQRDMTSAVTSVLGRLPGAHLYALDAVVKHFRHLVDSTKSAEPDNVYITKLALSLGRCVLRPQRETEVTIGDRTASLFLADLITTYHTVFPPLVDKKKKEAERVLPVRKRTALVDQRISRASFGSIGSNGLTEVQQQQVLEQHHATTHATPPKATPEASNPVTGVSALGLGAPVMEEPADTDDEDDKAKPRATAPVPVSTATSASAVPAPAPATVPSTTVHVAVPPAPVALADPVKPEAVSDETSRTVSPTPHSQSVYTTRSSSPTPRLDLDEDVTSPTASILDAMDQYAPSGDESAVGSGIAGLKRASSSEVSRLRGPRGARGPRPAPGRNVSHTMTPSLSSIPSDTTLATPPPAAAENEAGSERSGGVGVSGDYAPKRGKGIASAGAFGHKTRGSVSQAIAQFENRG